MFWNKKSKSKYKPKGKIGIFAKSSFPFYYSLIFERLQQVSNRTHVKILAVDICRNCTRNRDECLRDAQMGDWVVTSNVLWETDEQYTERLGLETPVEYDNVEPMVNTDIDLSPHVTNPFIHNFIESTNQ